MFKCQHCNTVFKTPLQIKIFENTPNEDIILVCPECCDDRITYIWPDEDLNKEGRNE